MNKAYQYILRFSKKNHQKQAKKTGAGIFIRAGSRRCCGSQRTGLVYRHGRFYGNNKFITHLSPLN